MEKYVAIEKPKVESEIKENEIRVTTQGKMRNSISYATTLFKEKGVTEVVLKAMGRAINKTVTIAEIIKRRIPGLHQNTNIDSTDITDVWEPIEEGLDRLETTRHVSSITITLSTVPLDPSLPGYQQPLPEEQVKEMALLPPRPRRERTPGAPRGRGGRPSREFHHDEGEQDDESATRPVGSRGRGRPRRGRRPPRAFEGEDEGFIGGGSLQSGGRPSGGRGSSHPPRSGGRPPFVSGGEDRGQRPRGRGGRGRGGRGRGGRGGRGGRSFPSEHSGDQSHISEHLSHAD